MAVSVTTAGHITYTHQDGDDVWVKKGHLQVMRTTPGGGGDVVAVYPPGAWIRARLDDSGAEPDPST